MLVVMVAAVSGLFLAPVPALARDESGGAGCSGDRSTSPDGKRVCQLNHIVLTVDTYIADQSGNFSQSNYVKVGPNDNIKIKVVVGLSSPPDLKVNGGLLGSGYGTDADWVYVPGIADDAPIIGFGTTLTPQNTTNFCGTETVNVFGSFDKCQSRFGEIKYANTLTTFTANSPVYTGVFTITPQDFQYLSLTHIKGQNSNDTGLNQITAYPDLAFGTAAVNFGLNRDWTSYFNGGANIFIQRYATDADKNNDTSNPPVCSGTPNNGTSTPPNCVPDYGTVSSGGNNIDNSGGVLTGVTALVAQIISAIVFFLQELVYALFSLLISPLITALLSIRTYTDTFVGKKRAIANTVKQRVGLLGVNKRRRDVDKKGNNGRKKGVLNKLFPPHTPVLTGSRQHAGYVSNGRDHEQYPQRHNSNKQKRGQSRKHGKTSQRHT